MARSSASKLGAAITAALLVLILSPANTQAAEPAANDLTKQFTGVNVNAFQAIQVGDIIVLRGRTADKAQAEEAARMAQSLGYKRVANLIQVTQPVDDDAIERMTERKLGLNRSLDGCHIRIDSDQGVVKLVGTVQNELQKDVAIQTTRNVQGVLAVTSELKKF